VSKGNSETEETLSDNNSDVKPRVKAKKNGIIREVVIDEQQLESPPTDRFGPVFICASVYLVLFYLFRSATTVSASYFGMEPVLRLDRILFLRGDLWYPHAVLHTYLLGTVVMFSVCVTAAILLTIIQKSKTQIRYVLIWVVVISAGMVCQRLLGLAVETPFLFKELGALGFELNVYSTFMRFEDETRYLLAFMGIVLAITTGIGITRPLLTTATSRWDAGSDRQDFVIGRLLIPAILSTIIVSVAAYPASVVPHLFWLFCMVVMSVVAFIQAGRIGSVGAARVSTVRRWPVWSLVALVGIALLLRLTLSKGLPF